MGGYLEGMDAQNSKYYGDAVILRQTARVKSPARQSKNGVLFSSRGGPAKLIYTVQRTSLSCEDKLNNRKQTTNI